MVGLNPIQSGGAIMAMVFVVTFAVSKPDWGAMAGQLFEPVASMDSVTTILALIGTTIVPYNLFLHASLVAQNEQDGSQPASYYRRQSALAIGVGGLITLFIMATAMQAFYGQAEALHAGNLAKQLAPLCFSVQYCDCYIAPGQCGSAIRR